MDLKGTLILVGLDLFTSIFILLQMNYKNNTESQRNTEENGENEVSTEQRPPSSSSKRPQSAVSSQRPMSATSERLPPKKNAVIPMGSDNNSIMSNKSKGIID